MIQREYIFDCIEEFKEGGCEEYMELIDSLDKYNDKQFDIKWMEAIGDIWSFGYLGSSIESWRWNIPDIAEGVYPLEDLPEHVRDLAKALYYTKKPAVSH